MHSKSAGLPNSVWIALIGAGIIYGIYKRKHPTQSDNVPVASDGSTSGTIQDQAPASFLPINPPTTAGTGGAQYVTNGDWETAAIAWVIGNAGTVRTDPITATNAIGQFLNDGTLSQEQARIINAIVAGIGPPPNLPQAVNVTPPPAPVLQPPVPVTQPPVVVKPPPQATHTYYTVKPGDYLVKIAAQFGTTWQAIYNANLNQIKNPNLIYPGQRLLIPV